MMLEGTTRTWLKGLPANSIGSWAELKAWFIQNFKDHASSPCQLWIWFLVFKLRASQQPAGYSTIIHSSDNINVCSAILMLEKNCRFTPLKQKLGWLKRHCNDMGTLMEALV